MQTKRFAVAVAILPITFAYAVVKHQVLGRCLAANRKRRFGSVAEMSAALLPALAACPVVVKRADVG